ncbi:integral membrane protein [Aspergillus sclerotialis]|uniref:Efficient mitochondria targeting-associated protein 19 n=1 Tax=Aspergillus sclerotialis TaxID=2070753 RepID=A0A3A2ZVV6_9EURO|nr:integral membrane protein [Aspergillus sclerotialis]
MAGSLSIWNRKRDLIYFVFFAIHAPLSLVDTFPLLPSFLQADIFAQLRQFYVSTYNDKFFQETPPPWFSAFICMELLYHLPLSIWATGGLLRDNPMVPVHLLVFGVQAFITTVTCLVEVWSWTDRTDAEKQNITMLYGPYAALGGLMALDMIGRLRGRLVQKSKHE